MGYLTSSPPDVRKGSQVPRIEHVPLFHTTAADDAIDLAAAVGLNLFPWQQHVLRGALGERVDGRWSAFRTCLVIPRQNGKNALLEARELAGVFLFGEQLITHTAHQYKTAHQSMMALMRRLKKVPDLMEYVIGYEGPDQSIRDIDGFKTGNNPGIYLKNDRSIQYLARSGDSGRGFSGDVVVLDEAYALKASEMGALLPTMRAKSIDGNPQMWITSSAGKHDSDYLYSLREQGKNGSSDRLAYYEWSADDDADSEDVDAWYEANPSMGYLVAEEQMRDEAEDLLKTEEGTEEFRRELLGIWAPLGGEPFIPAKSWAAGRVDDETFEESVDGLRVAFAVDVPPERDRASIGAAWMDDEGTVFVQVVDRLDDLTKVGPALAALQEKWNPATTVLDAGGAAAVLHKDLRRSKVRLSLVNYRIYGQSCGAFLDLVNQGRLKYAADDVLDAAADAARQSTMGDTLWKWNRKDVESDISPLVAVTLAAHGVAARRKSKTSKKKGAIL